MAASAATMMAVAGTVVVPLRNVADLSSSSSFGSPLVRVAPLRPAAKRSAVMARASLPEAGWTARREMLAGLMAAGAALVSAGSARADTKEKAGELLKQADDLTNNESPPRFGPGRGADSDPGQVAQKGGAGAVEGIQAGTTDAVEGAKKAVEKAKKNIDKVFGRKNSNKSGDVADASFPNSAEKLKSGLGATSGKVKSNISSATGKAGGFGSTIDEAKSKAGSVVADAQGKVEGSVSGIGSEGKKVFDQIQGKPFKVLQ